MSWGLCWAGRRQNRCGRGKKKKIKKEKDEEKLAGRFDNKDTQ